jgi:hypothetical protein
MHVFSPLGFGYLLFQGKNTQRPIKRRKKVRTWLVTAVDSWLRTNQSLLSSVFYSLESELRRAAKIILANNIYKEALCYV